MTYPSWLYGMLICQCNVARATPTGTLPALTAWLGQAMPVFNTLLLNPVATMYRASVSGPFDNYYDVLDPAAVDPRLGTLSDLAALCNRAKSLGIRVLLDVVHHGINPHSPIIGAHPDWFCRNPDGGLVRTGFGDTVAWDHTLPAVQQWWLDTLMVFVYRGASGFRADLDRSVTGYSSFWPRLAEWARSKEIVVMSEEVTLASEAYHLSQEDCGLGIPDGPDIVAGQENLSHFLSARAKPALTSALSSHDRQDYGCGGKIVKAAYACLLAPVMPVWYLGEESGIPKNTPTASGYGSSLYFTSPKWSQINQPFAARFRQLVALRRQLGITGKRDSERCVMLPTAGTDMPAYALNNGSRSVVVVGRKDQPSGPASVDLGPLGWVNVHVDQGDVAVMVVPA